MTSMLYITFFFLFCVVKAVATVVIVPVMSNDNNKINEMAISLANFLQPFLVRCLVFSVHAAVITNDT